MMRWIVTVLTIGMLSTTAWSGPRPLGDFEPLGRGGGCGVERWAVKTLTDPAASRVNLKANSSTVEQVASLPVPAGFSQNAARLAPEFQTYTVRAKLIKFKQETDSDIHLVIAGSTGRTMIAEIPLASCASGSRVQVQMGAARAAFIKRFGQPSTLRWKAVNQTVVLTGVLFFDIPHGQTGMAPNAVELHPVLALQ